MNLKVLFFALIIAFTGTAQSLIANDINKNDSLNKNFLEKKPSFKAIDLIKGDTTLPDTSSKPGPLMPGGPKIHYNPLQDSAYFRDLSIKFL